MALKNDLNAQFKSDLVNYNGASDAQAYILLGETVVGDTPVRIYHYDASSTATPDGENVLNAVGMGVGRFIKDFLQEFNPGLATVASTGDYDDLLNKPTIPGQVNSDWNSASGVSEILNKPVIKRQETYSGTSNSSGVYTVTFSTSFSVAPNIQANIINQSSTDQFLRITNVSATGFTINIFERAPVTLLGISLLPGNVNNVNGASIDVLITEK